MAPKLFAKSGANAAGMSAEDIFEVQPSRPRLNG
jgi:hypothetical protein